MLDSWDDLARNYAAYGLGFDYLFMVSYAFTLGLAALQATRCHPGMFERMGAWAACTAFLAAACDAIENLGQTLQLFGGRIELAPLVGSFATAKFLFLAMTILYSLVGWIWPARR